MERNYLIVVYNKFLDKYTYHYLENLEKIKDLKKNFNKNGLKIKHIYKLEELEG